MYVSVYILEHSCLIIIHSTLPLGKNDTLHIQTRNTFNDIAIFTFISRATISSGDTVVDIKISLDDTLI